MPDDAVYFVRKPPTVIFKDGMFHVCFDIGKSTTFEVAMSPNTFFKTRRESQRVVDEFNDRDGVVGMR